MKIKTITFTLVFVTSFICSAQSTFYQDAVNEFFSESELEKIPCKCSEVQVIGKPISFEKLSYLFEDELSEIGVKDDSENSNEFIETDKSKKKKRKLYFTEIKNNIFMAEMLCDKKSNDSYDDRPSFGISQIYLFRIVEGKVKLVRSEELKYN